MPLPKLNNLFVSKTCSRFCAIDLQISFFAFAIVSKKVKLGFICKSESGKNTKCSNLFLNGSHPNSFARRG